jgi:hypothetical protein
MSRRNARTCAPRASVALGALLAASILALGAGCSSEDGADPTSAPGASSGGPGSTGAGAAGSSSSSTGTGGGNGGSGGDQGVAWRTVLDQGDLDGAVLSIWGSAPDSVYAVGGPLGNSGYESLAVHYDGATWRRLAPTGTQTYWWVSGSGPTDVWMVGEEGRISHWDGTSFAEHTSGTTATLWGVWAASPSEAWAVGGTPNGGTNAPNDIVLRWDGASWTPEPLPGAALGVSLFKVWGTASDNLYVVGEKGTIWHREGAAWSLESDPALTQGRLFTVAGCSAAEVYAVGGSAVLRSEGQGFMKVDVTLSNLVNGVACGPSGSVAIVGDGGLKQRLVDGAWINEFAIMPYDDLHAAWADGAGAFWAVGGDFVSGPAGGVKRRGVVARYGEGAVASSISD